MRPDDLQLLHEVGDPAVRPDGSCVAVAVAVPDLEGDSYVRTIHLVDEDGARQFTAGPGDTRPRWSPDGTSLAFLRAPDPDGPAQLAVMPADGGEARVLTDVPLGVEDLAWSPSGDAIVVVGTTWRDPDLADLEDEERARRPRRITALGYRHDGRGWTHDRVRALWLVDPAGGVDRVRLTHGDVDATGPAWTPDGAGVVFTAAYQDARETDAATGVHRVGRDGGAPAQLAGPGLWSAPTPREDGSVLLLGLADPLEWPAPPSLHRLRDGEVVDLAAALDRDLVAGPGGPVLLDDGSVLLLMEDRGAVQLVCVRDDGHDVLLGGARTVTGVDATADGSTIACTITHPTDPGELWVLRGGEPQVWTSFNEELRERLLPVTHRTFERDGVELDAWVVMPEGDAQDVPLLLNVHGGPTAQYGHAFFDEFQVEAGAGYAVVGINPHGSSGRGRDFARGVVDAWHEEASVDVLDLEAVVDRVLAWEPRVSRERLGIMGGSYGGYVTARILARTERYRSAIVERGLLNWVSFSGTSDIGPYFDRMFVRGRLPQDADRMWAASPVRTADRITTPTLVLHSSEDHRCPPEQGLQLFQALRRHGCDAELLLFPGEGHELSRSGSPRHRVERFEAVLEWHDRHLGVVRVEADGVGDDA